MGDTIIDRQRDFFLRGETRRSSFRLDRLSRLREAIQARESDLLESLETDLGKPAVEAYTSEIGYVLADIDHAARHLPRWCRPRRRRLSPIAWPGRGMTVPEPYGVVLVLGPWNYPFQLLFSPLVGALAAGNCACLKPSELAPQTSRAVARLVATVFDPGHVSVVEGDAAISRALLGERFDYIFFTGSGRVGREVMKAAARHLTPVTLELGGKNPCLVFADARMDVAARRILWGKCLNAGQTCVAPDHVLVQAGARDRLVDALGRALREFFGNDPKKSPDYARIINRAHFDRLSAYLGDGRIALGGEHDAGALYLSPTVLLDVATESAVMQEEIFGPVLPILEFHETDEMLDRLSGQPKPLALYAFTEDKDLQDRIVAETSSGGVCINDTITHIMTRELPFGGVGDSGMGSYHGKATFDCFTRYRSVLRRGTRSDPRFRYPPYSVSLKMLKRASRFLLK